VVGDPNPSEDSIRNEERLLLDVIRQYLRDWDWHGQLRDCERTLKPIVGVFSHEDLRSVTRDDPRAAIESYIQEDFDYLIIPFAKGEPECPGPQSRISSDLGKQCNVSAGLLVSPFG